MRHYLSSYALINDSDGGRIAWDKTTVEKDLAIWCTNILYLSLQCHKAASKAMRSLGLIKRTFKCITPQSLLFLYKTYICPHLEYCVSVWSPYLDELEKVQHRSTKVIKEISKLPYEERLKILHLPSLYARRLHYSSRLSLHSRVPFTRVFFNFIRGISRSSRVTCESYFACCTRVIL